MEQSYVCPLLNETIDEGECYDVQMVLNGFIKPQILKQPLNIEKANLICYSCQFNHLPIDFTK
ncbi:MAG: hypothetical protein ABT01_04670 [Clostridium sp. SCN 57-10]|nr:MAG: hypothetical protein ABT01_04670 [Clostridium sp. SCN 57-10]